MYYSVTIVVEGVEEDVREFTEYKYLEEYLANVEQEALEDGLVTEVYILHHPHEHGVACECQQYVLDHKPARVFP